MRQVPARIWNEIAKSERLLNPSFQQLMAMPQRSMDSALNSQAKALEQSRVPDSVIVAYQEIAPLLAESQAISRYIDRTGSFSLRNALPEILSAAEAVSIASKDRSLSSSEKQLLLKMLTPLEPPTSINV